jgi:DNA repair exonuclease SbcCD ATPase subunit
MEITFHKLTLRNFFSYGNNVNEFNLNFNEPILVVGENLDVTVQGQLDSNGAGKTTMVNGLMYALFGKVLTPDVQINDIINNVNNKDMEVCLFFQINNVFYKISRFRKNKALGGNGAIIHRRIGDNNFNKKDKKTEDITPDSVSNINNVIESIIGMSFDTCARIILYTTSHRPFLSLPLTDSSKVSQKQILEEITRLTMLSEKALKLKDIIKEDKKDLENLVAFEERLISEKRKYDEQIEKTIEKQSSWEDERNEKIKFHKNILKQFKNIDFKKCYNDLEHFLKLKKQIEDYKNDLSNIDYKIDLLNKSLIHAKEWEDKKVNEINSLKLKINEYEHYDFDVNRELFLLLESLDNKLDKKIDTFDDIESNIKTSLNNLKTMKKEETLLEQSKCPYCKQQFNDAKLKLDDLIKTIKTTEENINSSEKNKESINVKIKKIKNKIKIISNELSFKTLDELNKSEITYKNYKRDLNKLNDSINPHNNGEINEDISNFKSNRVKINKLIKTVKSEFDDIDIEYESLNDLIKDENKYNNSKSLIDEITKSANPYDSVIDDYNKIELDESKEKEIEKLSDDIEHKMFLYKLLTKKDSFIRKALLDKSIPYLNSRLDYYLKKIGLPHIVKFTNEMTAEISNFGTPIKYANLSSGQKARIDFALSFAFRDVVQFGHSKINFCMLDECLDTGLSDVGVMMAVKMIKEVSKENNLSMYVVSHRNEVSAMFNKTLKIELKNRFSNIKKES